VAKRKALSDKQGRFISAYAGNGVEAARMAGYKGSAQTLKQIAHANLKRPEIARAIKARSDRTSELLIADRIQRQEFWTQVMNDKVVPIQARLKASELLGRSEGDFLERVEHSSDGSLSDLLAASWKDVSENK
jgi:phage terminase small subunit